MATPPVYGSPSDSSNSLGLPFPKKACPNEATLPPNDGPILESGTERRVTRTEHAIKAVIELIKLIGSTLPLTFFQILLSPLIPYALLSALSASEKQDPQEKREAIASSRSAFMIAFAPTLALGEMMETIYTEYQLARKQENL